MFFSNETENNVVLILNIGSGAVHGLLALIDKASDPKIIYSYDAHIPWKPHTDSSYLIKTAEKAIKETIDMSTRYLHMHSVADQLPKKISDIHYSLSSPWIVSQAKLITLSFEKETLINRNYILNLVEKERAELTPTQTESVRVIEEKIFDVRLNGYSVADWENKLTRKLDVSFTVSVAGARMIDHFTALCEHTVNTHHVFFHSSLLLQFIGIEKTLDVNGNYTLIHVHGELTDIAMIRDQSCIFFGSYPFGARTLVRKIAASTAVDKHIADSLVTLYTGDRLNPAENKATFEVIETISEGWAREFEKIISLSEHKIQAPETIVLSAYAHEDCFAKILHKLYPGVKISLISEIDLLPSAIHSMK